MSPSVVAGPGDTFEIKKILEDKRSRGKLYYFMDWKVFCPEERTWELVEKIDDLELIHKFHCCLALKKRDHKDWVRFLWLTALLLHWPVPMWLLPRFTGL